MNVAELACAALCEAGRPDLAELVQFFIDDDGSFYLEPMEEVDGDDLELMVRAERIALDGALCVFCKVGNHPECLGVCWRTSPDTAAWRRGERDGPPCTCWVCADDPDEFRGDATTCGDDSDMVRVGNSGRRVSADDQAS